MKRKDIILTDAGEIIVCGEFCGCWWVQGNGMPIARWHNRTGKVVGFAARSVSALRSLVKDHITDGGPAWW